jgi:hypothetical protein
MCYFASLAATAGVFVCLCVERDGNSWRGRGTWRELGQVSPGSYCWVVFALTLTGHAGVLFVAGN